MANVKTSDTELEENTATTKGKKEKVPFIYNKDSIWLYYKMSVLFFNEMIGACPEASVYEEHILQKTKKMIKEANRISKRVNKELQKYVGTEITPEKEIEELRGIIRASQELIGKRLKDIFPTQNVDEIKEPLELLEYAKEIESSVKELVEQGEARHATVFLRDKDGWPMISSHIILGNFKENLKIITNNEDKSIVTSKVAVGEIGALDVKAIELFIRPSHDLIRDSNGEPILYERVINFMRMGERKTCIALSEQLPKGTTLECHLRVRKESPFTHDALMKLLDLGKNNGLGCHRGSGNKGAYYYKLEHLPNYKETIPEGWN
jgi:hypothetical protein